MDEYGPDIITVVDDDGAEHEFEVLDRIETDDDQKYIAIIPVFDSGEEMLDDDGELIILRVTETDDENILEPIEDDDEFDEIAAIFQERLSDMFDFTGDEDEEDE